MSMTQLKKNTLMIQFYYTINIFLHTIFGIFLSTLHGIVSVNFTLFITFYSASEASHKTISGMLRSACRFKLNTLYMGNYTLRDSKQSPGCFSLRWTQILHTMLILTKIKLRYGKQAHVQLIYCSKQHN